MLKQPKPTSDKAAVKDVPADNPKGTIDRLKKLAERVIKAPTRLAMLLLRPVGA